MTQSRTLSAVESVANVAIGYGVAVASQIHVLDLGQVAVAPFGDEAGLGDDGDAEVGQGRDGADGDDGTVLDPVFALRRRVRIAPGAVARLAFWTLAASSRQALLDLIDKQRDATAFERAATLAWTQAQVQLRHLDVVAEEAAVLQRLAAPLLYADARFRAAPETIARGMGSQAGLWEHGISGDRPIVLLRIDDLEDLGQVRALLRGQEYWRLKRLALLALKTNRCVSAALLTK